MLNPWIILAVVLAIVGAGGGGFVSGHHFGTAAQKVEDQTEFDRINKQITERKAVADAMYRNAQAIIIQQAADMAQADNQREKERQSNVKAINDLRSRYAAVGLRFSTGQASGLGGCRLSADGQSADPSSHDGSTEIQLPDKIEQRLREIAYDADALIVDYTILYEWAHDPNLCPLTAVPTTPGQTP